jgi:hypothetical protein
MTSFKRTRESNHLFVLPIVALLVGLAFLLKDPEPLSRLSYVIFGGRPPGAATAASSVKPAAKPTPTKIAKPAASSSAQSEPGTTESNVTAVPAPPEPREAPVKTDPLHATVKTDFAFAYSSSSENSPVVAVLNRDTAVETNFELVNSEGRWTMIRTQDSSRPAFVRSENIQRTTQPQ